MANSMFDDIVLKARDLCDNATKKTGEIYEVSRYKYECIKLNGEIKKLYEQLGSSVYSMFKNKFDNQELIESLTEEIDEHLARLREINGILSNLQKVEVCSVCGGKNDASNVYCAKCGSKLKEDGCGCAEDSCECGKDGCGCAEDSCECGKDADGCAEDDCACGSGCCGGCDGNLSYTEDKDEDHPVQ